MVSIHFDSTASSTKHLLTNATIGILSSRLAVERTGTGITTTDAGGGDDFKPRMAATPPPSAICASISRPDVEQYCVFSPGETDRRGRRRPGAVAAAAEVVDGARVAFVDTLCTVVDVVVAPTVMFLGW